MPFTSNIDLHQLAGSLRTVGQSAPPSQTALSHWPFITISRQAGAGGRSLGQLLAGHLNAANPSQHPWQCLDHELVHKIAADHHLSAELIESLETSSHTWITEFFAGLAHSDSNTPSELQVFRRVVKTIHALARAGHVILVGLGSGFITRDMPGGVHVRIIAPQNWRSKNYARIEHLAESEARNRVKFLDHRRQDFYSRYWPSQPLSSDMFHVTFNASMLTDERMARSILPLVSTAL